MDHRIRPEGQNISPTTKAQPESKAPQLERTGERFLPGVVGNAEIAYDHIARYRLAERYVKGKKTIDLGCGTGYGTHALSGSAEDVLGVDLSEEAVEYAAWLYRSPYLRYEAGDVTNLPYPDGHFEAAISFEVIEHLKRPEALVEEARRLLTEDGIFVVSTPDKQTYSNDRNSVNPHHLREMYPLEFQEVLERHFEHVQTYRQGALAGSIITSDPAELPKDGRLTLESTRFSLPDPKFGREVPTTLYMLAVCKNGSALESLQESLVLVDCDRQIYEEHADSNLRLGQVLAYQEYERKQSRQRTKELRELRKRMQQLRLRVEKMQNSRGWRFAQRLDSFEATVRRILRRG